MNPFEKEVNIALLAAQRAARLTSRVFLKTARDSLSKDDKSPVTIGDFGAQALIISALKQNFPDDEIIAEEESSYLRQGPAALLNQIWNFVENTKLDDPDAEATLGGQVKSVDAMLDILDMGKSSGGKTGRIWTIDPIDGTKGFLRGGQYAVCIGLIVDSEVKVGVLACPNLPLEPGSNEPDSEGTGVMFSACLGHGAYSRPIGTASILDPTPISMRQLDDLTQASFCESVEAAHSNHKVHAQISDALGIKQDSVRMDSQAKYGSIARGAGDIYLRLPVSASYQEKIWDHAAGDLIVREAGGQVSDIDGKRLDFSCGRTLANNKGIIAASRKLHGQVLQAVQKIVQNGS